MDLTFERGEATKPKGHALVYFTAPNGTGVTGAPGQLWATYLIVLPITVDVTKYVPPFLMNQMGELGPKDLSAFAFPPSPEQIPDRAHLDELAALRDDDILYGGALPGGSEDVASAMFNVNEMLQAYSQLYSAIAPVAIDEPEETEDPAGGAGVNEVLYGLMSESDRLGELTRLIGRLRYAVDGAEDSLIRETEDEINVLERHLPGDMQVPKLVAAVKTADARGAQLAALYLQRSYHLVQEAFSELGAVDREIEELEAES
jgi:hypothetical protein